MKLWQNIFMSILYILGLLAFCYLIGGRAGFLGFWIIVRWPIVVLLAIATLLGFPIFGINPFVLLVVMTILAYVDLDKVPDGFWDLMNLIAFLCLISAVGLLLVEMGILT